MDTVWFKDVTHLGATTLLQGPSGAFVGFLWGVIGCWRVLFFRVFMGCYRALEGFTSFCRALEKPYQSPS